MNVHSLLTVQQVARKLKRPAPTLRTYTHRHKIGVIVGNTRLLSPDDVTKLKQVLKSAKMGRPRNPVE